MLAREDHIERDTEQIWNLAYWKSECVGKRRRYLERIQQEKFRQGGYTSVPGLRGQERYI
jgi:hypothetical protein